MFLLGDFNARTATLAPRVTGQQPRVSTDTLVTSRGRALLELLTQQELLLLSGTTQESSAATSLGSLPEDKARSVVDYVVASRAAAPWVTRVAVGDPVATMSDHCPLVLTLELPVPPT